MESQIKIGIGRGKDSDFGLLKFLDGRKIREVWEITNNVKKIIVSL